MAVPKTGFLGLFKPLLNQFSKWGKYYDDNWDAIDASASSLSGRMDVVEGVSAQVNADAAQVAADKATTIAAKDEALATKLIASGTATAGSATTLTDANAAVMGVDAHKALLIKIKDASGTLKRAEAVVSNTSNQWTFATGTAIVAGDTYEVYSLGNQSLLNVVAVQSDYGFAGNIANPDVSLGLHGIKMLPFASGSYSSAAAATDVTNYVGILKTKVLPVPPPAGVAAGQYALIGGIYYPVVSIVAGTSVTIEYDADDAEPAASADVIFCLWEFAGQYRGVKSYAGTSRVTYLHPIKNKLRAMPAGFPAFTKMSDGSIGLQHESLARTNSVSATNFRLAASYGAWGGTATVANDAVGIDGVANAAVTITDTDAVNPSVVAVGPVTVADDTATHIIFAFVGKNQPNIQKVEAYLSGGTPVNSVAYIDSSNGQLSSDSDAGAFSINWGDFWLVAIPVTNNGTGNTSLRILLRPCARATLNGVYDGTLTTGAIFDWPQIELNASAISSPIIGGATRNAQTLALDKSNMPAVGDAFSLVMDVEFSALSNYLFSTSGETTRFLAVGSTGSLYGYYGTTMRIATGGVLSTNTQYKIEYKYDGTNLEYWVDGALRGSWAGEAVGGAITALTLLISGLFKCSRFEIYRPNLTTSESAAA
jgi:hypothetical protein